MKDNQCTEKILSFDNVVESLSPLKKKGQKIVLCYGLFNFLHIGHIRYLKEARECGDYLVVGVCSDRFMTNKKDLRFEEELRAEALAFLDWVDLVTVNPFEDVYQFIGRIQPDVFVKGFESKEESWLGERNLKRERLEALGVELIILDQDRFISTGRINRFIHHMPEVVQKYVQVFHQRYRMEDIIDTVLSLGDFRILVVGDTILDEYQYCTAIGKSSKDPILALKYESSDLFAGGVLAVANHAAGFSDHVKLLTILGEKDDHETFIRSRLNDKIDPVFLFRAGAPTLIKRRCVEGYSMNKLLEIYVMDDSTITGELESEFSRHICDSISDVDIVIAADFGHGTISPRIKTLLSEKAPYLAVNAQSNAGNRGFNNITKYSRADYISIAEHEIRVEMRDMNGKIREMMETLIGTLNCRQMTVTRGRYGCMVLDRSGDFVQVPSFTTKVVDRVGAGDALFAVTSLASVSGAASEVVGFLGNIVGSLAVEVMGNQKAIDSQSTIAFMQKLE